MLLNSHFARFTVRAVHEFIVFYYKSVYATASGYPEVLMLKNMIT